MWVREGMEHVMLREKKKKFKNLNLAVDRSDRSIFTLKKYPHAAESSTPKKNSRMNRNS